MKNYFVKIKMNLRIEQALTKPESKQITEAIKLSLLLLESWNYKLEVYKLRKWRKVRKEEK